MDPAATVVAGVPEMLGAGLEAEEPDDGLDPVVPVDDAPEPVADCAGVAAGALELEPPQPERMPTPSPVLRTSSVSVPDICFIR